MFFAILPTLSSLMTVELHKDSTHHWAEARLAPEQQAGRSEWHRSSPWAGAAVLRSTSAHGSTATRVDRRTILTCSRA
jgi:hypothetical protein